MKLVGYYKINEDTVMTDNSYENASWYKKFLVKSGKYEVIQYDGYSDYYVRFYGEVIEDSFVSTFGGVGYGNNRNKHIGETHNYSRSYFNFEMAEMIEKGIIELVK